MFSKLVYAIACLALLASLAQAQCPAKSIHLIVPNAPGGGADATGRIFGGALLCSMAGIKMTNVAYKGAAPALVALMSGEIEEWARWSRPRACAWSRRVA
jgi:tripartite-type tricarboxylate transporter receptor subunit TctC